MGLRTWVKGLFGKPEAKPMSYSLRPDPWAQVPQTIDRIIEDDKAQTSPIVRSALNREDWEQQADEILGDREWDSFMSRSSKERLIQVNQLQRLIQSTEDIAGKAELWRQCGRLFHAEGDTKQSHNFWLKAFASYDKAIEFKPDYHEAWHNRGCVLNDLGRYEEAIESYDKAIQFRPDDHITWANRGSLLFALGRKEEAIESYDKAIQFKSDFHEAWRNHGLSLNNLGRNEEAIDSFNKAIELKPDFHQAWANRGSALDGLGRYEEAIESYDKVIGLKPDCYDIWYIRGNILHRLGRYEEAIESFNKAIEFKLNCWSSHGSSLGELGRYEEAIESFNKAIALEPDDHRAWANRGLSLSNLSRYKEAIESFNKAIEFKPDYYEAWSGRGNSLSSLVRHEESITSYEKAIEFKPNYHEAWYNRGISLNDLGRNEESIISYEKAIEFKPDFHQAWYNRGSAAASSCSVSPHALPIILNQRPANLHYKHPELSQRGYEGQFASLTVGLTYCPAETHPLGHGVFQHQLGNTHLDAKRFSKAFKAYQTALTVLTESQFPKERLLTLQQIICLTLTQGNLSTARHYQTQGSPLYETLRTQAQDKRTFEAKFSTFRLTEIDLLIGENEPARALKQAEFYKNRALTWLLDPPNPLKKGEQEPDLDSLTITTDPHQLKVSLFKGDLVGSGLNEDQSIVYWHQSEDAITTFILTNDNAEPIVLDCDRQQQHKRFIKWKED